MEVPALYSYVERSWVKLEDSPEHKGELDEGKDEHSATVVEAADMDLLEFDRLMYTCNHQSHTPI